MADVAEAVALRELGVDATFVVLSPTLPEHSDALLAYGCEPVVCNRDMLEPLSRAAQKVGRTVALHLKVDTGMGRVGIRADEVLAFLELCRELPGLHVRGIMSHFARADETDKTFSLQQIERFRQVIEVTRHYGIEVRHMANSAGILDLPGGYFDAARPGIAVYGGGR